MSGHLFGGDRPKQRNTENQHTQAGGTMKITSPSGPGPPVAEDPARATAIIELPASGQARIDQKPLIPTKKATRCTLPRDAERRTRTNKTDKNK